MGAGQYELPVSPSILVYERLDLRKDVRNSLHLVDYHRRRIKRKEGLDVVFRQFASFACFKVYV